MSTPGGDPWTSMTVKRSTYRRVKACKRGGETFDQLLAAMSEQYNPESAELSEKRVEAPQNR
jgi:hypothetical protein